MARLPEGALMQRAAAGLAYAVLDLLGAAYGRRVLLLVGSGDNGGDALYAGALLARRGVQVEAWLLSDRAHEAGLAALDGRRAGRVDRPSRRADDPTWSSTGSSASAGAPGLRPEAAGGADGRRRRAGRRGRHPERRRRRHRRAGRAARARRRHGHLRHPQGRAPRRPGGRRRAARSTSSTSASTCPAGAGRGAPARRRRRAAAATGAGRAQVHPRRGRRPRRQRAVPRRRAAQRRRRRNSGLCGMVRYVGEVADRVREAHPEVVGAGRVQAWVVGSGGGDARRRRARGGAGRRRTARRRRRRAPPRRRPARRDAVLTPHAGELAAMLGADRAEVEAGRSTTPARRPSGTAARCCSRAATPWSPHPDGRVRVTTTGTPWLATAGAGDVLGGLIGALLAAGLAPYDAASVGSWLHGAAATLAGARRPAGRERGRGGHPGRPSGACPPA